MATKTHDELISEGLLLAGNTSLTDRASVWLNAWLRSQYAAWPWPFLRTRREDLSLPAGTQSLTVGAGNSGITPEIHRIFDPIKWYKSDYSQRGEARVVDVDSFDESSVDTSLNRGTPSSVKIRENTSTEGAVDLIFDPVPDRDLLIAFDYHFIPAAVTGSTKPRYPNDRTLIQVVYTEALKHMDELEKYAQQLSVLASMTVDDRVKHGSKPGINQKWAKDPNRYRY